MAQENIGTTRSILYISWAWELEQAGNFKGAEKVSNYSEAPKSECSKSKLRQNPNKNVVWISDLDQATSTFKIQTSLN